MHKGSRIIIIVVQIGAVKIYVAAVEAGAQEKERKVENSLTTKIDGFFFSFRPP